MSEADEVMKMIEQRVLALDRVWDLVTDAESAGLRYVLVSTLRAAITTSPNGGAG